MFYIIAFIILAILLYRISLNNYESASLKEEIERLKKENEILKEDLDVEKNHVGILNEMIHNYVSTIEQLESKIMVLNIDLNKNN